MAKSIFRELFVMLLLCVAIILILAVVFYEYNPINKVVPTTLTYTMPENLSDIKEELETPIVKNDEQVLKTYKITEDDLKVYKQTNYDAGKANPFTASNTGVTGTNNGENEDNSNNSSSTNNNTTSDKNNNTVSATSTQKKSTSSGNFFEDGSTK